jgi:hypothetical protein
MVNLQSNRSSKIHSNVVLGRLLRLFTMIADFNSA